MNHVQTGSNRDYNILAYGCGYAKFPLWMPTIWLRLVVCVSDLTTNFRLQDGKIVIRKILKNLHSHISVFVISDCSNLKSSYVINSNVTNIEGLLSAWRPTTKFLISSSLTHLRFSHGCINCSNLEMEPKYLTKSDV